MEEGFLWGAATSAHQVEGNNVHNDWWDWEQANAKVERSGIASDHYRRYAADLALAKSLGHNAHRFSVEWSRIEPSPGKWNKQALAHYRDVLVEAKKQGLTTFVTLHHFTNPQWLAAQGGWEKSKTPEIFARYVKIVVEQLGDLVDFWVTVNEPMVYATQAYWCKRWPPQKRSQRSLRRVIKNLAKAHGQAYRVIHAVKSEARVGVAKHLVAYLPENEQQLDDRAIAKLEDVWFNHYFYKLTKGTHDFIGVNYYFARKLRVKVFPPHLSRVPWRGEVSDLNWPVRPEGLTHVLL